MSDMSYQGNNSNDYKKNIRRTSSRQAQDMFFKPVRQETPTIKTRILRYLVLFLLIQTAT
jgi:hypothetical protein